MTSRYMKRHHSTVANFEEAAWVLEDHHVSPVIKLILPSADNTPTITWLEAKLVAAVDGGKRVLCTDGKPCEGLHVIFSQFSNDELELDSLLQVQD